MDNYSFEKTDVANPNENGKVCITCKEHGDFWMLPSNFIHGQGCPTCQINKLEGGIRNLLEEHNIEYVYQKRFGFLGRLSLDFYLPKHKLAIECQGRQHFEPIDYYGGMKAYREQVERDKRKSELCKENNIDLKADRMALQRLKEAAEKAKIELSGVMSTNINLPFITADATGPKHLDMTLTRAKFDELTRDLVDATVAPMQNALRDAGLAPEAIGHINAHATSTQLNDKTETKGIKLVFGEHASKIKISATKSMTGHLLGAAGGVESVFTAMALHTGWLPGTINLENPDPNCDLDYMAGGSAHIPCEYAMCNSFGFGGTNASLILKKWND